MSQGGRQVVFSMPIVVLKMILHIPECLPPYFGALTPLWITYDNKLVTKVD